MGCGSNNLVCSPINDQIKKTKEAHEDIWQFHLELDKLGAKHIFFNGNNDFSKVKDQKQWGTSYIEPVTYTLLTMPSIIH